jgi:protein tyrosine phosphatase
MNLEEIEKELEEFEGDVYYISLLPQFVWSETEKTVMGYHEYSTPKNKLIVMDTELVDLGEETLSQYIKREGVTEEDVIVLCINKEFLPKKGNYVLIKIMKKIKRRRYDSRRMSSNQEGEE